MDLAGLPSASTQEGIAESIVASLESAEKRVSFLEAVIQILEKQHRLLVLDNCEHIDVACLGLVRTLRKRCPRLTLLLTSRKQLARGFGESVSIPPLAVPSLPSQRTLPITALCDLPVVQLFADTMQGRHPEFTVTEENRDAVVRLCQAADGLPLAIRLLASGASPNLPLPFEEAVAVPGAEDFPDDPALSERSRTMFRSVAWSCRLLSSAERELFYRTAIFVGGWTLPAAEAILGDADLEAYRIPMLLDQLQAASLVTRHEQAEGARYTLLQPLREYALHQLQQQPSSPEFAQRHLDHYLKQAEELRLLPDGEPLQKALRTLTGEVENLRAALDYGLNQTDTEKAIRLAAALARFWFLNGRSQEGRAWLDRVLVLSASAPAVLRRRVLHGAGIIAYVQEDLPRAKAFWNECLNISREQKDPAGILQAQGDLGNVALTLQDFATARTLFTACLEAYRERESKGGIARTLANLALTARGEGDYMQTCTLHAESIALFREQNDLQNTVLGLNNMAQTLITLHRYSEAHQALSDSFELCLTQDNPRNLSHCMTQLASLAAAEGFPERAALFTGAEETLRTACGALLPARSRPAHQELCRQLAEQLGEAMFAALQKVGSEADLSTLHIYIRAHSAPVA